MKRRKKTLRKKSKRARTRASKKSWFVVLYDGDDALSVPFKNTDRTKCSRYACLHNARWMFEGFAVVVGELPRELAT